MNKILFIISTDDGETIYNAMRFANVAVNKGDEVSVFMLGKGVLYEKSSSEQFNVIELVNQFQGDFYGKGVIPISIDTTPQPLICLDHAKKHSPHYPQYMPSRHTARKQPPGRIPGKRGSVVLSQVGRKISRAIPCPHHGRLPP